MGNYDYDDDTPDDAIVYDPEEDLEMMFPNGQNED